MPRRARKEVPAVSGTVVNNFDTDMRATTHADDWRRFFWCQRSPVLRSQLLGALMTGSVLQAARVPTKALLDALLLAFTARVYCNAEIIDDYAALVERVREEWRKPTYTCKVFDQLHGGAANLVAFCAPSQFVCFEDRYIPELVGWYLQQDAPVYFAQEFETDAEVKQWRRRKK